MAYGVKYNLTFVDFFNQTCLLEIREKDYTGGTTGLTGSGKPIIIETLTEKEYRFTPIKGKRAVISLIASSIVQYDEFKSIDSFQYQVELKLSGGTRFIGFLETEGFHRKDLTAGYEVTLIANDRLAYLKNIRYPVALGSIYDNSKLRYSSTLMRLLLKTGLTLEFYENINLYEDDMDIGNTHTPLTQTYFPVRWLLEDEEVRSCYDVLKIIMIQLNAVIFQNAGAWTIYRPAALRTGTTHIRRWDVNFSSLISNANYDITRAIGNASTSRLTMNTPINKSLSITMDEAYNNTELKQELRKRDLIISDFHYYKDSIDSMPPDWSKFGPVTIKYKEIRIGWDWEVKEVKKKGVLRIIAQPTFNITNHVRIHLGNFVHDNIITGGVITSSLKFSFKGVIYGVDNLNPFPLFTIIRYNVDTPTLRYVLVDNADANTGTSWEIFTNQVYYHEFSESGVGVDINKSLVYYSSAGETWAVYVFLFPPYTTGTPSAGALNIINISCEPNPKILDQVVINTPINPGNTDVKKLEELKLGEVPYYRAGGRFIYTNCKYFYDNLLYYYDGADYQLTKSWSTTTGGVTNSESVQLAKLLSDEIVEFYQKPTYRITGVFKAHFNFNSLVTHTMPEGRNSVFLLDRSKWDVKAAEWDITGLDLSGAQYLEMESGDYVEREENTELIETN